MNSELKQFLDMHLRKDTDTTTVTVFPLPCGTGKSEYVKYAISDALNGNYGLIVITDLVDNLKGYISAQDEQLTEFIKRNIERVSILYSETVAKEAKTIHKKPIILMSTQRYFDLSKNEILNYTKNRKKIIFDEKPYILSSYKLTINSLNKVDTALNEALDDTVNKQDKVCLIGSWNVIKSELREELEANEELNTDYKREIYFNADKLIKNEAVNTFYSIISKYKPQLNRYNPDAIKVIEAVKQLLVEGIITSQKVRYKNSGNDYSNYFTVLINKIDKLINVDAKVYVLDGTADISPEYRLKCIDLVDCSNFNRDLSQLTINIVNVNTSKDKLTKSGDKTENLIKSIIDYIKSQPQNIDTIFTYKAIATKFTDHFEKVNWFGNIKGSNQYRKINNICQVGLNRWSELIYMLYANEIGIYNDGDITFSHRIYDEETIDDIRCRLILADIEQNLFRCKIRNADNTEPCTYTLICNVNEHNQLFNDYHPLIDMIKLRYERLGATINIIDTPPQFKLLKANERNTKNKTSIQKFDDWYKKQPSGRIFKRADVLTECNLTAIEYKSLKNSKILNNFKTGKQGIYVVK